MSTNETTNLIGQTTHVLRGSKYMGAFEIAEIVSETDGWVQFKTTDRVTYSAQPGDMFTTEAAAKAEGKSRRKPRQARTPQPLYGDFAMLAMFSGIRTDGTGRVNR